MAIMKFRGGAAGGFFFHMPWPCGRLHISFRSLLVYVATIGKYRFVDYEIISI